MRPGSIYAGLGNKDAIYTRALEGYIEHSIAALEEQVAQHDSPLLALKAFVKYDALTIGTPSRMRMCFAIKTLNELPEGSPLAKLAAEGLKRVEGAFAAQFKRAQIKGEIPSQEDSQQLGRWLQIQITGIRCLARMEQNPTDIEAMVEDLFTRISA